MEFKEEQYRKSCKRYDEVGHVHYLTFSCFRRQPFLAGSLAPAWLAESINAARCAIPFSLLAYVFMPEHAHLLVWPREGLSISTILKAIKQPVAIRAVRYVKEHSPKFLDRMQDLQPNGKHSYRFWQRGGGYDRNLWTPEQIRGKIRYIHLNPVRRKLVDSPEKWQWSSWRVWEEGEEGLLKIDRDSLAGMK